MKGNPFLYLLLVFPLFSFASGFDESYSVYSGDINGDGRTDLYVSNHSSEHVPVLSGGYQLFVKNSEYNNDVSGFALTQNADSTFTIKSSFTSAELDQVSQWPKSAVKILLADFNIDGIIDILLSDIASVIAGTLDQIVFAPTTSGGYPQILRAVDDDLETFFEEFHQWLVDKNYFDNNAPISTQSVTINDTMFLPEWCAGQSWVDANGPLSNLSGLGTLVFSSLNEIHQDRDSYLAFCHSTGRTVIHYDWVSVQYTVTAGVKDYTGFNQQALAMARAVENASEVDSILIDPSNQAGEIVREIFQTVIGAHVPRDRFKVIVFSQAGSSTGPWTWENDKVRKARFPYAWFLLLLDILNTASSAPRPQCEYFYRGDAPGKIEFWADFITERLSEGKTMSEARTLAHNLVKTKGFPTLGFEHAQSSIESPYISVTTNFATAEAYAAQSVDGVVYELTLPEGMAKENPHTFGSVTDPYNPLGDRIPDYEWLVLIHIPSHMVNNPNPAHCIP